MKRSDFNRVFRDIHWDESKRLDIEAMLSRPCKRKKPIRRIQKEEVYCMSIQKTDRKPSNGKKIIAVALSACAVLGISVGAATLLHRDDDPLQGQSSMTSQQGNTDNNTDSPFQFVADHVKGDLQTKFNGPDHVSSMTVAFNEYGMGGGAGQIMAAESGWYCTPLYRDGTGNLAVYVDEATGQHTPLCSRPECTHDSEYCEANNSQFYGVPYCYYDGYLYGVAADQNTSSYEDPAVGEMVYPNDRGDICLMRYAPDGMELTKLCKLQDALTESIDYAGIYTAEIIGHKGALWISVEFGRTFGPYEENEVTMPNGETVTFSGVATTEFGTGYALFHYDIAKDKLTTVIEVPMVTQTDNSFSPFSSPTHLCASGDYVYFRKEQGDWADPYNGDLLFRVDIRTGAIEELANGVFTAFALSSDKLVYLTYSGGWYNETERNTIPCILDLQTGEETLMFEDESIHYTDVQCTAEYIILTKKSLLAEIEIYDWEGKLVATLDQPREPSVYTNDQGEESTEVDKNCIASIGVSGDRLYACCTGAYGGQDLYYASLSEVIANGTVEWKTAYVGIELQKAYEKYSETEENGSR